MRTKGMGQAMPDAYLLGNDIGSDDDSSQAASERFKAEIEWLRAEIGRQGAEIERLCEALTSLRNTVGLFYDAGFADGQAVNGQAARKVNGQAAPKKTYRHLKALNVVVIICLAANILLSTRLLSASAPVMTASISWEHHPHHAHRHRHGHTVRVALESIAGKRRRWPGARYFMS